MDERDKHVEGQRKRKKEVEAPSDGGEVKRHRGLVCASPPSGEIESEADDIVSSGTLASKPVLLANLSHEAEKRRDCPYLGTVNRLVLDFDFEKLCHVTMTKHNVYCCLVCNKFLEGRGPSSLAFSHALQSQHYLFINLKTAKIYCLPENYEVDDKSLEDIKFNLHPRFTREELRHMRTSPMTAKALDGSDFIPGLVGINNIKFNDYVNVVIQMICVIDPLRDYLAEINLDHKQRPDRVVASLSELIRKIHNPNNFKGIVSPHEFLQAISIASHKRFTLLEQSNPLELLVWLLNHLHKKLSASSPHQESVLVKHIQGQYGEKPATGADPLDLGQSELKKFWVLSLEVPSVPVFKSQATIPTVPIFDLLLKFDGETITEPRTGYPRRLSLWKLPEYLILHFKRFNKTEFAVEKNPTIVTFPLKNLDLTPYIEPDALELNPHRRYDVIACVCHVGKTEKGAYKIHVWSEGQKEWYEIEDLRVTPTLPQLVVLSESYIQLYKLRTTDTINEL